MSDDSIKVEIGLDGIKELPKTEQPSADPSPEAIPAKQTSYIMEIPGDIPDLKTIDKEIRELSSKALLIAFNKLLAKLENVDKIDPETMLNITLKLLDANMAYDWADAFRQAILKKPSTLPSGKTGQPRVNMATSQAARLEKVRQGDQRTTPKKLLGSMPKDDSEERVA